MRRPADLQDASYLSKIKCYIATIGGQVPSFQPAVILMPADLPDLHILTAKHLRIVTQLQKLILQAYIPADLSVTCLTESLITVM